MKLPRVLRSGWSLALCLLGGALATSGCNTYHYYDIDIQFGSVSEEEAGVLQLCVLQVSGAASHYGNLPSSTIGDPTTVCPISHNYPQMGKFEFATFADSGSITFTVTGYKDTNTTSDNQCTSGTVTMNASATVTQTNTITMSGFDDTKCPTGIIRP
jgi:hypothetical protein